MSERWSLLVVDRDSESRSQVRRLLLGGSARQYDFIESSSGQDALEVLRLVTPTCLIVGDELPDMDAAELLSGPDRKHSCAALVLTASVEWSLPRLSSGGAVVDCLPRSWINPTSLTRALENAVERQALLRDREYAFAQLRESESRAQIADVTQRRQTETVQVERDERFQTMANAAPVLIWETDATGVVFVNRHYLDFFGVEFDEVSGMGWARFLHPSDAAGYLAAYQTAFAERRPYSHECRFFDAAGEERWLLNTGRPLGDGFVGFSADITDGKRASAALRESRATLQGFYDSAPMMMGLAELEGEHIVTISCNRAMADFFSTTPDALSGQTGIGPDTPPEVERAWADAYRRSLKSGTTERVELEFPCPDGPCWLSVTTAFIGTGPSGRPRFSFVAEDVTARKKTEAQLHDAARQKDEFIAMLAHELRNPLAPIRTAVAVLRSRGTADPIVNQCSNVIDRQGAQMARLLDDLLDVSRLSRGRLVLQREPVVLQDVIDAAAETAKPHIQQHQHELVIDYPKLPIVLQGDAVRLAQVLGNLLNNAAKFTPTRGRIAVTATQEERDVVVTVRDNGIGIAPEQQHGIFTLFSQLVDSRRAHSGLGIGLSLARQLVEMHDGSITVSSDGRGSGSTFTVRLPLMRMMEAASQAPQADAAADRLNHRVVVADDNADAAEMLAAWLRILGCDVRTVHDGVAAFHEIERLVPDAAFIDLAMPGMGGYELCRRIRQTPWGAGVTLVALTGWGQENDRSQSAAAGFDHHILKPADLNTITELLREVTPKAQ